MSQKNETIILLTSLLITAGIMGLFYGFITNQQTIKSLENNNSQNKVAKKIQQTPNIETIKTVGWIYIGKVERGNDILTNNKTIKGNIVPEAGTSIETSVSLNLRTNVQGEIIGVVDENSKLTVQKLSRDPIVNSNFETVWAKVNL